jgi:hypothetical protein
MLQAATHNLPGFLSAFSPFQDSLVANPAMPTLASIPQSLP